MLNDVIFISFSGQPADKEMVAKLGSLLCIQLGATNSSNIYRTIKALLISILNDHAQSSSTRASVSISIVFTCPIAIGGSFKASKYHEVLQNCMFAHCNVAQFRPHYLTN